MSVPSVAVVGAGAVARAIARMHVGVGGHVVAILTRDPERAASFAERVGADSVDLEDRTAEADALIVAVTDRAIAAVGARTSGFSAPLRLHTSGALPGRALGGTAERDGSLHPLQSVPRPAADDAVSDAVLARRLDDCHWFHEGAGGEVAARLVRAWGGHLHSLAPGAKTLYHAAAAIVSNHSVALFDAAAQLLDAAGLDADDAREPLAALLAGTCANLRASGAPAALTGPVARGDVETVRRHVDALHRAAPHLVASYVELALLALDVAVRRGSIDAVTALRLRRALRT